MAEKQDTSGTLDPAAIEAAASPEPYEPELRDEEREYAEWLHDGQLKKRPTSRAGTPGLLPIRHPNLDFFLCDISDASPKDDIGSMEHPMFALRAGDRRIRRYEHNGRQVEIVPSALGHATIHDKDILIYCTSQLIEAANRGRPLPEDRTVRITAHDLLVATNRQTSGVGYRALLSALKRLRGTTITTNIDTAGGISTFKTFGLIDNAAVVSRTKQRQVSLIDITLNSWLFDAITRREVLTLSRYYFRIRSPLGRRLDEIARKHCGAQPSWKISLPLLHKKSGASGTVREFRRSLAKAHELPDYRFVTDGEMVIFENLGSAGARAEVEAEDAAIDDLAEERKFREQWERDNPGQLYPKGGRRAVLKEMRAKLTPAG